MSHFILQNVIKTFFLSINITSMQQVYLSCRYFTLEKYSKNCSENFCTYFHFPFSFVLHVACCFYFLHFSFPGSLCSTKCFVVNI